MRGLAAELDVKAPTLYWHFASKRALLDALAETIAERGLAAASTQEPGERWWDWLARRARAFRTSLLGYPDGGLIHAGTTPPRRDLSPTARLIELMTRDGVPRDVAQHAVLTVSRYTVGCVIEQQQAGVVDDEEEEDRFERGLALIIAGVKAAVS